MRGWRWTVAVVALACQGAVGAAEPAPAFAWPGGARAAVSLAYDDALDSQLDHAIPALDRHGFKASFYLTLGAASVRQRMEAWRAAARNGHELGNHSLFHQCSARGAGRAWVAPQQDLDRTTIAQMRDQVRFANTVLQALDGSDAFTYTAPCGDRMAADGDYLPAVADAFLGIKLVDGNRVADMATFDPLAAPTIAPVGYTGAQLIALVEDAARRGTLVGLTFHGIGGDHLQNSIEAHDALLAYLARHRDVYWVDTFRNQMRWVRAQRALRNGGAPAASPP